jgi:uncharacterized protein
MTYRILSLDGGGAWAILEAMALKEIYGNIGGRAILSQFDLVASNSGGSIVLGALIADFTPQRIIDLFLSDAERAKIFVELPWYKKLVRVIGLGPRYSNSGKRDGIAGFLGPTLAETHMKDLTVGNTKIFIVGFDYDFTRAVFYRNYSNTAGSQGSIVRLADAISASSSAPVNYFDHPTGADDGRRHWDGGLGGYNNPMLAAAVEARIAGIAPQDIAVLSLGTGTVRLLRKDSPGNAPAKWKEKWEDPTLVRDIKKVATAILDDPPDAASYIAYILLGNPVNPVAGTGSGNIVRLNPMVHPIWDAASQSWRCPANIAEPDFDALFDMDTDAAAPGDVLKVQTLGQSWIGGSVANQPVRMGLPLFSCDVGDASFAAGKTRWLAFPP